MKKILQSLAIFVAMIFVLHAVTPTLFAAPVDSLQQQINNQRKKIKALNDAQAEFEARLLQKRKERSTLSRQLNVLDDTIEKTRLTVEKTNAEIEETNLEIKQLEKQLLEAEQFIEQQKEDLAALVRQLARLQSRSVLQIFFSSKTFSEFYRAMQQYRQLQRAQLALVSRLASEKEALGRTHEVLEEKGRKLVSQSKTLTSKERELEEQQGTKQHLLQVTRSSEKRYATLLAEAKREQEEANSEIITLEQQVREQLRQQGVRINGDEPGMIWPVPNTRGISATFNDPDYPFRHLFEHSAIDIRAYQGTPIRAVASGYVARARTGGARGYGFIMLVHDGGISSVYGHPSRITVGQNTYVVQGQIIGYSGGLPGTPGAGPFSTGPHLHFEIRKNGIPVNPLNHLP